ncbi:MAG: thiamine-binding protein, partial [Chloroflexota bacterium]
FSKGISRVLTTLKIDDRRDKKITIDSKIESVLKLRPNTRTGKKS